jgi:hypothetical protein
MPLFNKPLKTKKGKTPAYLFGGLRGKSETDDSAVVYYERIDVTMKKWGESLISPGLSLRVYLMFVQLEGGHSSAHLISMCKIFMNISY